MVDIQFQIIGEKKPALHAIEVGQQIVDRFLVEFHHFEVNILALKQILREHSHSGTDFQDVSDGFNRFQRSNDALRRSLVYQEMLT